MEIRDGLFYTEDHEWVKVDGDVALLGLTDYAQDSLGDIVYVELPFEGDDVDAGDSVGSVESVKAASEVYAPVAGEVVEVNEELEDAPELLNEAPYDHWICKIEFEGEVDGLMDADAYREFVE